MTKIYLASSWRNEYQPEVLGALRAAGHEVYDFRNPHVVGPNAKRDGHTTLSPPLLGGGFAWSDIDPHWEQWTPWAFTRALGDYVAKQGFKNDWDAMEWANVGVLLLPSGRSAHIEAGYFAGHPTKSLHILIPELPEPELMYKMADQIHLNVDSLIEALP